MDDHTIVQLYWERNESAISQTVETYGAYCTSIAMNILGKSEDAEECVNDACLRLWNTIPPYRPNRLSTFLGKIVRNIALSRYRQNTADKRGGGNLPAVLEELAEVVTGGDDVERALENKELGDAIDAFLESLTTQNRGLFVRRYWHTDCISDLADRFGMSEGAVTMSLKRTRQKLHNYLTERGFDL